jgi:uncharacterized FAD-dependent dehydrogenase
MLPTIGQGIELITRKHLIADLKGQGLDVVTKAKVIMIEPNQVLYEDVATGDRGSIPADRVALAVGWRSRGDAFGSELGGRDLVLAGDATRPADFVAAIQAGAAAGMAV